MKWNLAGKRNKTVLQDREGEVYYPILLEGRDYRITARCDR